MQPVRHMHQPVEICWLLRRDKVMTRYEVEIIGWLIVGVLFVFAVGVLVGPG